MKILVAHNQYQQRGGEDSVVQEETALLRSAGHEVHVEIISNSGISGALSQSRAALSVIGNSSSRALITGLCADFQPDVVHIHNFFPLLSRSAHLAASESGAAVVQTLHNYRILCAAGTFLRDGVVCQDCLDNFGFPALSHSCYRGSFLGSAAVIAMQRRTVGSKYWLSAVDQFIALTDFGRSKFIEGGIPEERISVKPNFSSLDVECPLMSERVFDAIFVGRLTREKGIRHLILAFEKLPNLSLKIIGDGPEEDWIRRTAPPNVQLLGSMPRHDVLKHVGMARILVFPSIWFEGFPMTIAEALSVGTPIVAGNIGAQREIIASHGFGFLYEAGNADDLACTILAAFSDNLQQRSVNARRHFLNNFSADANLKILEEIYLRALRVRREKIS